MADSSKSRGDGKPARAASSTPDAEDDELTGSEAVDDLAEAADDLVQDADQATQTDAPDVSDESDEIDEDEAAQSPKPKLVKRNQTVAPVKKAEATRKQSDAKKSDHKRTTPVQFTKQAIGELKKVVWPSASTTRQYFIVVLVFVLFVMAFVAGLDALFGWLLLLWLS
ncbi:preprotein translocase subunit SecE [Brooklawnia sp.]|uniref:preprotein translocase subunit SecE n=1 Tax=Brooklawnia sp. TaxID=2699740 RepID=UPI00311ED8D0